MLAHVEAFVVETHQVPRAGRHLTSGWLPKDPAAVSDRNVELWIEKPL
ncbi:MAG: hypothetical protein HYV09_13725 [Deltaproteobacteria bacterium]|nr:hypothetical protein [Deltaproteobacteria bacterium]